MTPGDTEPMPASLELAQSILHGDNPFLRQVALIVGHVMELNYEGVTGILNDLRGDFEARGAGDLLEEIEGRVDDLFRGFITEEREGEDE